ncbi:MAG: nuclear transport factor 2 family protein [Actinomycetota bacterium]
MSQENVELVRSGYRAFAEGNIETVLSLLDPDITLEEREPTLNTPSTYHGHQGLLDMVARVNEGLEDVKYAPERFVDVGDQVLVEVRRKGRGSLSGVPVERWQFHIWDIAEGRLVGFRTYADRQEALEAAGLRE